jgi:putative ATP-dependent endonuclease of OLD family
MRIARIHIVNFANFTELNIETGDSIVVVGENKVGQSNPLLALRLVLDPGLSERDRQLSLEHIWDGLGNDKIGATVEISLDLTDFQDDERLLAHLADCLVDPGPPMVARLTYRFQPKPDLTEPVASLADYDYVMFGGDDADRSIGLALRRMLPLDVLDALRDAEKDLATWRRSPLRPLVEDLAQRLEPAARDAIIAQVDAAQGDLSEQPEVSESRPG